MDPEIIVATASRDRLTRFSPVRWLTLVAGLTALVLVLTASGQIYDTNFQSLWEATSLLAGDHPYRDFFEWGMPLQVVMTAAGQVLAGKRLIAEFVIQWVPMIIGATLSFHIALSISRSVTASLVTVPFMLAILAATPTFHYPKLFFYPLAVWLAWRYVEQPSVRCGAVFGVATAVAFLYRHDHGLNIGGLAVLAFGLARLAHSTRLARSGQAVSPSRTTRSMLADALAYAAAVIVVLAPWLIVVQTSEGLIEYVQARAFLYREWSAGSSPYQLLLKMNPVAVVTTPLPPVAPAVISFEWGAEVDAQMRDRLERLHGLRRQGEPDGNRLHYEIANPFDTHLRKLRPYVNATEGIDWDLLRRLRWHLPDHERGGIWLMEMALVIPLVLLASVAADVWRRRVNRLPIPLDIYRVTLLATFLAAIDARLFRESSYVVAVAPLTAAAGAWLLVPRRRIEGTAASGRRTPLGTLWSIARWTVTVGLMYVTAAATVAFTRHSQIFDPVTLVRYLRPTFAHLLASPPIDGLQPAADARRYTREQWVDGDGDAKIRLMMRYMHDCTRAGDRVLVTGSTPYHVGYYVDRPVAGGHLFWHHGWRADPPRLEQSFALLAQQSVPFAISTHDPVLNDLAAYPKIRDHFVANYRELDGSHGLLLIDSRRPATGTFGALGFPCFR
jgi:hypothetical protein